MSTLDSLLLLVSSSVVKDIYLNYIKPEATMNHVKKVSLSVTAVIGIVDFLMALDPTELLIYLNLFAFVGLDAAFVCSLELGLYLRYANACGAFASMVLGIGSHVVFPSYIAAQ